MADEEISRTAERIEMQAWIDMMAAMPDTLKSMLGADCGRIGGALSISLRAIPAAIYNRAWGLGLDGPSDDAAVRALARHVHLNSAPVVQIQVAPFAASETVAAALAGEGFAASPIRWAKMGRRTADPPTVATDLRVQPAGNGNAEDFADVILRSFGLPLVLKPWLAALPGRERWRCYVALDGQRTVAGAAMYLDESGAWLGIDGTAPEARRLGGQSALLARRVADAGALGRRWAFTETGILPGPNPSLANMRRAGFELLHERSNWVLAS